jgi:hypothetical protein
MNNFFHQKRIGSKPRRLGIDLLLIQLTCLCLSLIQFSILNTAYIFLSLFLNASWPQELFDGYTVFMLGYPLLIVNVLGGLVLQEADGFFQGKKVAKNTQQIFLALSGLIFLYYFFSIPINAPVLKEHLVEAFQSFSKSQLLGIWTKPISVANLVIVFLFLYFGFSRIWDWLISNISQKVFGLGPSLTGKIIEGSKLSREYIAGSKSAALENDFVFFMKKLIGATQRTKGCLGFLGIRLKDELGFIEKYGAHKFQLIIKDIALLAENISRRGEDQMVYESNIVTSVLLANESGCKLAANRFKSTIEKELKGMHPEYVIDFAVAVFGIDFSDDTYARKDVQAVFDELMWGIVDASALAQTTGKVEVTFR